MVEEEDDRTEHVKGQRSDSEKSAQHRRDVVRLLHHTLGVVVQRHAEIDVGPQYKSDNRTNDGGT